MKIFKNKNSENIQPLKDSSRALRADHDYVIAAVKKYGSSELESADSKIMNDSSFLLKLVNEIPQAAAIIPDVVIDRHLNDYKEIVEEKMPGFFVAIAANGSDNEVYKHLNPKIACDVRQFETLYEVCVFDLAGKSYKIEQNSEVYARKGNPEDHEARKKAYIDHLDELRPDVKKLAEERESGVESGS